jgi:hypothetical protein
MYNFWLNDITKPEYVADAARCDLFNSTMLSATGSGAKADSGYPTGMTTRTGLLDCRPKGALISATFEQANKSNQPGQRPHLLG